jgi:hypothetical protein
MRPKIRRAQDSATFLRLVAADPLRADARGALPTVQVRKASAYPGKVDAGFPKRICANARF